MQLTWAWVQAMRQQHHAAVLHLQSLRQPPRRRWCFYHHLLSGQARPMHWYLPVPQCLVALHHQA